MTLAITLGLGLTGQVVALPPRRRPGSGRRAAAAGLDKLQCYIIVSPGPQAPAPGRRGNSGVVTVNWQHSEPSQPTARPGTGAVGSTDTEPRDIGSSNVPIAASYATGTSLPVRVWSDLKPDKFVDNIWVRLGKFPSVTRTDVGGVYAPLCRNDCGAHHSRGRPRGRRSRGVSPLKTHKTDRGRGGVGVSIFVRCWGGWGLESGADCRS